MEELAAANCGESLAFGQDLTGKIDLSRLAFLTDSRGGEWASMLAQRRAVLGPGDDAELSTNILGGAVTTEGAVAVSLCEGSGERMCIVDGAVTLRDPSSSEEWVYSQPKFAGYPPQLRGLGSVSTRSFSGEGEVWSISPSRGTIAPLCPLTTL